MKESEELCICLTEEELKELFEKVLETLDNLNHPTVEVIKRYYKEEENKHDGKTF